MELEDIDMKQITLAEKMRIVKEDEQLRELFYAELSAKGIQWSKNGCKVNGKKVGIQKYDLAQKYAAAFVYDNRNKHRAK